MTPRDAVRRARRAVPLPSPSPAAVIEVVRLRLDPLFHGAGAPHVDAAPILLVGGVGAGEAIMRPLRDFLIRLGWRPRVASMHRGLDCSERSTRLLQAELRTHAEDHGQPTVLLGHSRGGQIARVAAARESRHTTGLITLGTPFEASLSSLNPVLQAQATLLATLGSAGWPNLLTRDCLRGGSCCSAFRETLAAPWPQGRAFVAVHAEDDATVRWRDTVDPAARTVLVPGGHLGLLFGRASWAAVAEAAARCLPSSVDA